MGHHFKSIGEFKLKLQSGNAQIGSKLAIFVPGNLEIWWMTLKNNKATLLYYIKLCASFQSHGWNQTGVTVRKCSIRAKIGDILSRVTSKFDWWPWKTMGHFFYTTSSFVHQFKAMGVISNCSYSPETLNLGQNRRIFVLYDLGIWWMTLKNNRTPSLYYLKLCASFRRRWLIQTGVRVRKRPIWVQIDDFWSHVTLKYDRLPWKTIGHLFYGTSSFVHYFVAIGEFKLELQSGNIQIGSKLTISLAVWPWNLTDNLENNRTHLLSNIKLCASFHHHMRIQTGVTVRKRLSWVLTSVILTFDLWPRPFAWTSLLSLVITPENFMMIRWWEHSQNGVTDRQTDRRTDRTIHIAAWSQLKTQTKTKRKYISYERVSTYDVSSKEHIWLITILCCA